MKKLPARLVRVSPAMVVAMLALMIAVGGSADAAKRLITGRDIRNGSITGLDIKNKSVTALDFRGQLRGPRGFRGAQGSPGAAGAAGPAGATGSPGQFVDTVPSGKTLRGAYGISGTAAGAEVVRDAQSFVFRLPAAPLLHFIASGASPLSECPGTAESPAAQPGHLCVYEHLRQGSPGIVVDYPGDGESARNGFIVQVSLSAAGAYQSRGTWAVTAL